jgi:hypothetical protein
MIDLRQFMLERIAAAVAIFLSVPNATAAAPSDRAHANSARSLAAEAALVLQLRSEEKVSALYSSEMLDNLATDLQDLQSSEEHASLKRFESDALTALRAHDERKLRKLADEGP